MMRVVISISLVAVLMTGGMVLQKRLTGYRSAAWSAERMSYLPRGDRIKPYLAGFHTTYANYLWIRTMLYFGSNYMTSRNFPWLVNMIDIVTRLNPSFYPPYEFAGLMIPEYSHDPAAARIILERGIASVTENRWKLLFYLGWIYHSYLKDDVSAAAYLARAAHEPNVPRFIVGLAAVFYRNAGQRELGTAYLQSLYLATENPQVKRYVEERLKRY